MEEDLSIYGECLICFGIGRGVLWWVLVFCQRQWPGRCRTRLTKERQRHLWVGGIGWGRVVCRLRRNPCTAAYGTPKKENKTLWWDLIFVCASGPALAHPAHLGKAKALVGWGRVVCRLRRNLWTAAHGTPGDKTKRCCWWVIPRCPRRCRGGRGFRGVRFRGRASCGGRGGLCHRSRRGGGGRG